MAITSAICTSFKKESWQAIHDFGDSTTSPIGGDVIKLALINLGSPQGTYSAASTNYSDITGNTEEAIDSNSPISYSPGGGTLTNAGMATSGTTVYADFADLTFTTVTLTCHGCMIYNSSKANRGISVHDFGGAKSPSNGNLTITFPTPDASNAIYRLA